MTAEAGKVLCHILDREGLIPAVHIPFFDILFKWLLFQALSLESKPSTSSSIMAQNEWNYVPRPSRHSAESQNFTYLLSDILTTEKRDSYHSNVLQYLPLSVCDYPLGKFMIWIKHSYCGEHWSYLFHFIYL